MWDKAHVLHRACRGQKTGNLVLAFHHVGFRARALVVIPSHKCLSHRVHTTHMRETPNVNMYVCQTTDVPKDMQICMYTQRRERD